MGNERYGLLGRVQEHKAVLIRYRQCPLDFLHLSAKAHTWAERVVDRAALRSSTRKGN